MVSDYKRDAEAMKDKLGHSMCLAKWQQSTIHLTNGMTSSCYHPPLHKIDVEQIKDNPSALHNTDQKKMERKQMLEGNRPSGCDYCWTMENDKELSDRHYRSGEPWAAVHFDRIKDQSWDVNEIPSYVEVDFSNVCNLACLYCSPQFSSTWAANAKRFGPFPTSIPHNDPAYFTGERKSIPVRDNPYVDAFWKWWPQLYPNLKHFRMTGGEPTMDENTYRVFEHVLQNPKPDLHLNVTSNFSTEPEIMERYVAYVKELCKGEKIEHFMQYVSVDTVDDRAEYVRDGLDYEKFMGNIEKFLIHVPQRMSVTFIATVNIFSTNLVSLIHDIEWLRSKFSKAEERVWFDTPVLRHPSFLSFKLLPKSSIDNALLPAIRYMKTSNYFREYEIEKLEWVYKWATAKSNVPESRIKRDIADFYMFITEHEKRNLIREPKSIKSISIFNELRHMMQIGEDYARSLGMIQ